MRKLIYEKDGARWIWRVFGEQDRYFTTNREGQGIFVVSFSPLGGSRCQLAGTCQFSLSGLTESYAKAKVRRWMAGFCGEEEIE